MSFFNRKPTLVGDEFTPPQQKSSHMLGGEEFTPQKQQQQQLQQQKQQQRQLRQQITRKVTSKLETLFEEEANKTTRNWSENLTFYTGTSYLSAGIIGGLKGTLEGLKAVERGDTFKIRVNRVLNGAGSVGGRFGNRAGALALLYSGFESGITSQLDVDADMGSVLAGVCTGVLFRGFTGVRGTVVGGVIGGVAAASVIGVKRFLDR